MSRYTGEKGKAWDSVKKWSRRAFKDCYTCHEKNLQGANAQAGHYRPVGLVGLNNTRAWDERFIRLQCGKCNGVGQGEQAVFRARLVKELGESIVAQYDKEVASKKPSPVKNWQEVINRFSLLHVN